MIQASYTVPLDDAKHILALYFGVEDKNVIRNQYSFTVIGGKLPQEEPKEEPEDK